MLGQCGVTRGAWLAGGSRSEVGGRTMVMVRVRWNEWSGGGGVIKAEWSVLLLLNSGRMEAKVEFDRKK
jgi:hypothetical protein